MKNFTKLLAAFALLVFMMPSLAGWGQTQNITYVFNTKSWGTTNDTPDWTSKKAGNGYTPNQGIQVTTGTTGACGNSDVSYSNVSKITVTYCTNTSKGKGSISWYNVSSTTANAQSGTLVGTQEITAPSSNGTSLRTFDIEPSSSQTGFIQLYVTCTTNSIYVYSVKITYTTGGGQQQTVATPQISGDTPFFNSTTVSISCDTEGASIQYSLDNGTNWSNYTSSFTLTETTTVKAKATKSGMTDSAEANKTFTKVTPLANIAALTANTTADTYYVTLTNAVVTFVSGNYAYIQDASGAVAMYKSGHGLTAGDVLNGTATVAYQVRNGNPQITDLSGVTPVSGTAPDPTSVAQSAWNYTFSNVLSQYFQITGATITLSSSKYYVSLGGESIQLYKIGTAISTLDLSKTYTITGFPTLYISGSTTVKELQIFTDPEVVASTDPSINADDVTLEDIATSGSIAYTIDNPVSGQTLTARITAGNDGNWLTLDAVSASAVSFTCTANETNSNRTATITLSYQGATDKTVTVTQDKYFAPASLPFEFDGGRSDVANKTGLKQENLGTDYTSSPKLKFDNGNNTASILVLKINERPGTLSFKVKGNPGGNPSVWAGTFQVLTSTNGTSWSVLASYDDLPSTATTKTIENIDADVRYFKWVYSKTSGNVALGDINLAKYVAPAQNYTLSIGELDNVNDIFVFDASNQTTALNANGDSFTVAEGTEILVSIDLEECYFIGQSSFLVAYPDSQLAAVTEIEPNVSYSFTMPSANATIAVIPEQADQYTLTVAGLDHISNVQINSANLDANNQVADICEQSSVVVTGFTLANGYVISSVTLTYGGETTAVTTNTSNLYEFQMPSSDATLTFTTANLPTYTLATSIENGRHYIITNGVDKAMGAQSSNGNNRTAEDVNIENGVATVYNNNVREVVINGPEVITKTINNQEVNVEVYTIYDAVHPGYLYNASASKSYLKTQEFNNANGQWTIEFDTENAATITSVGNTTRPVIMYNSNNTLFNCYESGQGPIYLYVKNETTPQYDFYKDIAGYGNNPAVTTGWNFIASPVTEELSPSSAFLLWNDYDLYRLNNTTWENYKAHTQGFILSNGTGYLYANSNDVTLHFTGSVKAYDANYAIPVSQGWNLVGNPYSFAAYPNQSYYTINDAMTGITANTTASSDAVYPCTGILVNAASNGSVKFFNEPQSGSANNGNIQMTLAQTVATRSGSNTATIDNAIVSFNEGSQLEKFYFGTQNANLYIPQNGEEFAIATSDMQGEMPVNFKAAEDGQYTITVNAEDVEMGYLHLIDNLTGANVDLLATPSYTFNAKTTDYASRFRLVFSANEANAENDNFAFVSNGQIILNGANNNATLQVIDMMGRIVSTQQVNGNAVMAPVANGVYVLQLINGNEVKTQKIVVK